MQCSLLNSINHPDYFGVDINSKFEKEPGVKDMGQVLLFKQGGTMEEIVAKIVQDIIKDE